jgi:hypothetical protein
MAQFEEGLPAMPDSDPVAHTFDVPGARLYYERRGAGPLLMLIGLPMENSGFAGRASALAGAGSDPGHLRHVQDRRGGQGDG